MRLETAGMQGEMLMKIIKLVYKPKFVSQGKPCLYFQVSTILT